MRCLFYSTSSVHTRWAAARWLRTETPQKPTHTDLVWLRGEQCQLMKAAVLGMRLEGGASQVGVSNALTWPQEFWSESWANIYPETKQLNAGYLAKFDLPCVSLHQVHCQSWARKDQGPGSSPCVTLMAMGHSENGVSDQRPQSISVHLSSPGLGVGVNSPSGGRCWIYWSKNTYFSQNVLLRECALPTSQVLMFCHPKHTSQRHAHKTFIASHLLNLYWYIDTYIDLIPCVIPHWVEIWSNMAKRSVNVSRSSDICGELWLGLNLILVSNFVLNDLQRLTFWWCIRELSHHPLGQLTIQKWTKQLFYKLIMGCYTQDLKLSVRTSETLTRVGLLWDLLMLLNRLLVMEPCPTTQEKVVPLFHSSAETFNWLVIVFHLFLVSLVTGWFTIPVFTRVSLAIQAT